MALISRLKPTNKIGWLFLLLFCLCVLYQIYDAIYTIPLFFNDMTDAEKRNWQANFNEKFFLGFVTSILGFGSLVGYIFHIVKNNKRKKK